MQTNFFVRCLVSIEGGWRANTREEASVSFHIHERALSMATFLSQFQVFLSYGRADASIVRAFYRTLQASGICVWMDVENIQGGEEWQMAIKKALSRSQLVLIFLSNQVIEREGYLQDEILEALEIQRKKPPGQIYLVPVRLDDCVIHPRLEQFHCISLCTETGSERLIQQIQEARLTYIAHHQGIR
jgi:hypothetical protein